MAASEAKRRVSVTGIPRWIPAGRLLGLPGLPEPPVVEADDGTHGFFGELGPRAAADLAARLRGVGLGGRPLSVEVTEALPRSLVRAARTADARRRRDATPGFERRGARVDAEGRVSLTPERLALRMGEAAREAGHARVLDLGAGCGGNAIGFARAGLRVVAVERDPGRLRLARHNARLYEVAAGIDFVEGEVADVIGEHDASLWFVDPPWGVDWNRTRSTLDDLPLLRLLHGAPGRPSLWAKVPPSFDPATLPGAEPHACFGEADGDRHRVKFVWLRVP